MERYVLRGFDDVILGSIVLAGKTGEGTLHHVSWKVRPAHIPSQLWRCDWWSGLFPEAGFTTVAT